LIVLHIPLGLYNLKPSDNQEHAIRVLASRMYFEDESQLRIVNKHGLDTIMQLNYDTPDDPVTIKSVC
jgi:hypothetical protein